MRNPAGLLLNRGQGNVYKYPKQPLTNTQLINKMQTSGIEVLDNAKAENALLEIGYYRL